MPFLKKYFEGRKILICREMTKYYEEFIRYEIDKIEKFDFEFKGELTIVISEKKNYNKTSQTLSESDKKIIDKMIDKFSIKEIANIINQYKDLSKKEIYSYCVKLKNEK